MKIPVKVLGERGNVGSTYTRLLHNHPWFELSDTPQIIFSALPSDVATTEDPRLAQTCGVLSHAAPLRSDPKIPLIIPEINPHPIPQGPFLVAKPNCSIQSFMLPLAPLHSRFGVRQIHVTTLQSISGAGKRGLAATDIHDNILPDIEGEVEKTETEPLKIWNTDQITISAQCNRVPVMVGHHASVSVKFHDTPTQAQILEAWETFAPLPHLPSSPKRPVIYREGLHPQNKRDLSDPMAVTVGQLRPCPHFDFRFVALSHNTVRGAAGGGILIAELLVSQWS